MSVSPAAAKDHPGHVDDPAAPGAPAKPAEDRSLFYGLHRALAVEADRHFRRQIETVWNAPLLGGHGGAPGAERIDDDALRIGHGDVMQEAGAAALAGSRSASAGGRAFAQRDRALASPAVRGLLDLVDLYISHPAQTRWWRPMFDDHVAAHADEVHADVLARNRTRGSSDVSPAIRSRR